MLAILANSFVDDSQKTGGAIPTSNSYVPFVHLFGDEMTLTT